MSRYAMEYAHEQAWARKLDPHEHVVLIALAYRANWKTGLANSGATDVADRTGLSARRVLDVMARLRSKHVVGFTVKRGHPCRWYFPPSPRPPDATSGVPLTENGQTPDVPGTKPLTPRHTNQSLTSYEPGSAPRPLTPRQGSPAKPASARDATFTTTDGDTFIPGSGWVRRD